MIATDLVLAPAIPSSFSGEGADVEIFEDLGVVHVSLVCGLGSMVV